MRLVECIGCDAVIDYDVDCNNVDGDTLIGSADDDNYDNNTDVVYDGVVDER